MNTWTGFAPLFDWVPFKATATQPPPIPPCECPELQKLRLAIEQIRGILDAVSSPAPVNAGLEDGRE